MALELDPNYVFRDFVTHGLPSSGKWDPRKPEIRRLLTEWWQILIALVGDATDLELPNLLINMSVTGGDENNIVAEANLPVPSGPGLALFSILTEETNTGPITINGKPLLSSSGSQIPAGGLVAGGLYLFLDSGDAYRLLSDYASSTILQAAEDAIALANAAKEGAEAAQAGAETAQGATVAYRDQAQGSAVAATTARDDIVAIANATGPAKWYDTHALAVADLANIAADQAVGIFTDETQAGLRSLYRKEGSALVFKTVLDSDGLQAVNASRLGADPTGAKDSKAAFVAAATLAKAMGSNVITARPGTYLAPGMTVDDILDCYLVGDGIQFVKSTAQHQVCGVYPFTLQEWSGRGQAISSASASRGTIGIELDDALAIHWRDVFPLFKEMGVTFGVVWPVDNGAIWIKEAYRHGFEIIAHGLENEAYSSLSPEEIHSNAQHMLDKIEAVTGHRDNVSFVYPMHMRNERSDEILRRYFNRGRGAAGNTIYPLNGGHLWNVTAFVADNHYSGGDINDSLKYWLQQIAFSNGRGLLYLHYVAPDDHTRLASFRKIIEYCQYLGIRIERPSDVVGKTQLIVDPFFERPWGEKWTAGAGNGMAVSLSTEDAYWGSQSLKIENADSANRQFQITTHGLFRVINSQPGFSLYRFKVRRKHGAYNVFSHQSLSFFASRWGFNRNNGSELGYGNQNFGYSLVDELGLRPAGSANANVTIPATDGWEVFERIIAVDASVTTFMPGLAGYSNGPAMMRYDDYTIEYLGNTPTLSIRLTLNGTNDVIAWSNVMTGVPVKVAAIPLAPVVGSVSAGAGTTGQTFRVRSSSPADVGVPVDLIITPSTMFGDLPIAKV